MNEHLDQRGAGRFGVTAPTRRVSPGALTAGLLSIGLTTGLLLVTSTARGGTRAESSSVAAAAPASSVSFASPAGPALPTVPDGDGPSTIPTVPSETMVPAEPPSVPSLEPPTTIATAPAAPPAEDTSAVPPAADQCLSTSVGDTTTESLFDPNSATLRHDQKPRLDALSEEIFTCGLRVLIRIVGHTDIRPTTFQGGNEALAIARAEAVRDYLISLGHDPSIFEVEGRGDRDPKVPGTDLASLAENRRVEVTVLSVA